MSTKTTSLKQKLLFNVSMIVMITANKGGTGKSFVSRTIIDGLIDAGVPFTLMECDVGIPDTARLYNQQKGYDIDTPEGWRSLYDDLLSAPTDRPVIITMPGGFLQRARTHMPAILGVLPMLPEHLKRPLRVLWVGDDKRDVIESLRDFRKETGDQLTIDFVKNENFCPASQFTFFDTSQECQILKANGGQILHLPKLSYRIAQMMTNNRLQISSMKTMTDLLDKIEYTRWWSVAIQAFRNAGYVP